MANQLAQNAQTAPLISGGADDVDHRPVYGGGNAMPIGLQVIFAWLLCLVRKELKVLYLTFFVYILRGTRSKASFW